MRVKRIVGSIFALAFVSLSASVGFADGHEATAQRARDLGAPFPGQPGPLNAITDVAGVEVGHTTLISGDGALVVGQGPIRTGVTAIHPRGKTSTSPVFASWFTLNASGEMTGTTWIDERGLLDGPVLITNTHSVGVVRDAAVAWMVDKGWKASWHAPVVAETYDGALNDTNGFHVTRDHALEALARATTGRVAEGSVGGGTGMICNGFKGGIGTSSRIVEFDDDVSYTVGVLVQCNYGGRRSFRTVAGVPVTSIVRGAQPPCYVDRAIQGRYADQLPFCDEIDGRAGASNRPADGSIIVIVATDAPLLPHQLHRIAKRPSLAIGRIGGISSDGSGDIFLSFSTAHDGRLHEDKISAGLRMHPNDDLSPFFVATIEATEEAILNAMVAADTMVGIDGLRWPALPEGALRAVFEAPGGQ
ncbi:MAG: P1 family peptidase [Pseudomonadota bacterium]